MKRIHYLGALLVILGGVWVIQAQENLSGGGAIGNLYETLGHICVQAVAVASGVDYVSVTGSATGNPATVTISAAGSDTNINLNLAALGTGVVEATSLTTTGSGAGYMDFTQGSAQTATASSVGFQAPASVTSAFHFTLPGAPAGGLLHATNATPSVISVATLTTYSNQITSSVTLGTSSYTASSGTFPAVTTSAAGTWLVVASLELQTTSTASAVNFTCELYDGTNVFAQGYIVIGAVSSAAARNAQMPLVGIVTETGGVTFTARCTSTTASQLMEAAAGSNSGGNYSSGIVAVGLQ